MFVEQVVRFAYVLRKVEQLLLHWILLCIHARPMTVTTAVAVFPIAGSNCLVSGIVKLFIRCPGFRAAQQQLLNVMTVGLEFARQSGPGQTGDRWQQIHRRCHF